VNFSTGQLLHAATAKYLAARRALRSAEAAHVELRDVELATSDDDAWLDVLRSELSDARTDIAAELIASDERSYRAMEGIIFALDTQDELTVDDEVAQAAAEPITDEDIDALNDHQAESLLELLEIEMIDFDD
jgi:hypothetical protein